MKGSWYFCAHPSLTRLVRKVFKSALRLAIVIGLVYFLFFLPIVFPIRHHHREARVDATKSQIAIFETSLDTFETDTGRYPTTAEGLNQLLQRPADVPPEKWDGPYLKTGIPLDPWNHPYRYLRPGRHNKRTYDITSAGPDGSFDTNDDIANYRVGTW